MNAVAPPPPYNATQDLIAVTSRASSLQLERAVLASAALRDRDAAEHLSIVVGELAGMKAALEQLGVMAGLEPDPESPVPRRDEEDDYEDVAVPFDVREQLEAYVMRAEELAFERDDILETLARTRSGAARRHGEELLEDVEHELAEIDASLDALAQQIDGSLADGGGAEQQVQEERASPPPSPHVPAPEPAPEPEPEPEQQPEQQPEQHPEQQPATWAVAAVEEADSGNESSDSDGYGRAAASRRLVPLQLSAAARARARPQRSAGPGRVGDRALTLAAAQVASDGGSGLTKRGAARAQSRALREGGLSFAMRGVRMS